MALRLAFLLAVICGITGIAGAPLSEETQAHSRSKRGPGGLVTILELTRTIRGFCGTIKDITEMLEMYPLNAVGDVLFNLPVPFPNIQYFDRLNLISGVRNTLLGVQRFVNNLNILNLNFGKRDLSNEELDDLKEDLTRRSMELRDEEYFDPPTPSSEPSPTIPPHTPGLLLTMRDVFGLQDIICPGLDFVESALTKSPIAFLHLERLPVPLPDGEHSFNIIKAFDLYNLTGLLG